MTDAERIETAVTAALPIPGWMSEGELRHLATRASTCTAILEIGSWQGRSTRALAAALPADGVLYAIDNWQGEASTPVDTHELRGAFMRHLLPEIILGRVIQYTASSIGFARMLRSGWIDCLTQFDYIFIDGDHSRAAVYADVGAYLPFVRPGGILAGHDYQLPDVRDAVRAMAPGARCVVGSIWESPR